MSKKNGNILKEYLLYAPASHSLQRAIECRKLKEEKERFIEPILDIGCGDGFFASMLFDEPIFIGIDLTLKELTLSIIIPTYNEIENISSLLSEIFALDENFHVLIVDDNSPDGTGKLVDKLSCENPRLNVYHRPSKQGLGSAYVCGFKYALAHNFDFIFQMDADFSHNPKYLPQFLKAIEDADVVIGSRYIQVGVFLRIYSFQLDADVVIGSRYIQGISVVNWSLGRLILSLGGCFYVRLITGLKIKDITGGFKCFRRKVLESINLDKIHSDGYAFQIEMNYKCTKKGFVVKERSIIFVDRRVGISKMSGHIVQEAIIIPWKLILGM